MVFSWKSRGDQICKVVFEGFPTTNRCLFFSLQKKLKSGSMHRTLTVWLPDEKLVAKEGKEGTSTTFYQQIVTTLTFGPPLSMKKLSGKICELTTCALHYLVSISKYIHRSQQLGSTEIWGEIFSLTEHYQLFLLDPFYIFVIRKGAIWGGDPLWSGYPNMTPWQLQIKKIILPAKEDTYTGTNVNSFILLLHWK